MPAEHQQSMCSNDRHHKENLVAACHTCSRKLFTVFGDESCLLYLKMKVGSLYLEMKVVTKEGSWHQLRILVSYTLYYTHYLREKNLLIRM